MWDLVPRPEGITVIGTKWIYKNKSDENGTVTRNNARLVAQGYTQIEGLDFDETFAPVARLESIRLLLGVSCILKFKLFQMDVNSEGEKNHKKGVGGLNCVFKNFSFLRSEKLFPDSESEVAQSLSAADRE